ncbi:hypothetical protein [Lysobacter antibioticus]|uniref:hypothetical protein n=1 Tax=Lysobacter antibioticus TaxID=84531 RepID=UPI000345DD6C|nr:hypothetical protein [Lysobacter antibioticus]
MKIAIVSAALSALLLAAGAASAATPACQAARTQVEVSHIQRVNACTTQGPNNPLCLQSQQVENVYWQMMDAQCPAPTGMCAVQRQLYNIRSQQRQTTCQRAGSSSDPTCQAAMQHEQVAFLQVKMSCFVP